MARLNINGKTVDVQAEPDTPLLWVIREQVGLTGTKYGCGVAQCGACSVHINGEVQRSCSLPLSAVKASDADIDEAMTNICRCGTYQRIREAVHQAAGSQPTGRAADRATRRS